ncbi:Octaprenyl-diphosphate synthase [Candidatus Arsenophonus lipoptenae]|uniref:Octaprenyl diphosphate synthase n=1 Tax=Candidatus Arsenophonus lipoptenae TaxID=634113 RepID=A0A0X9WB78_9GAMM|nr:octaprenyl diphosphate synthase [Candidatus Arsenophonus lipoptenae]AMA65168.1 Octaprenyl-diphosphate synthase [Candidatus Arsenophonus lipoptenae]
MNLKSIIKLTAKDMEAVNKIILNQLNSDIHLINQLGNYIISSGGKKIRPMIAILIGKALRYKGENHINIAALVEFIHTATLLHDDVIDKSLLRRGKRTANAIFGNAASVLVGDFIYTKSFQMMTELNSLPILKLMSDATNIIAEGEILQLINCNNPNITENTYMQIIYSKTARLFEATTHASAIVSGANDTQQQALRNYGRYLGTAFQLIDDLMDYDSNSSTFGKNIGDDLNEGKLTLPLLHAMENGTKEESKLIRNLIKKGNGRNLLDIILITMKRCGSLEYTKKRAKEEADKAIKALDILSDTSYKDALISLVYISIQHTS